MIYDKFLPDMPDTPRRQRLDVVTVPEKLIQEAIWEFEKMGGGIEHTQIIVTLGQVKDKMADWLEDADRVLDATEDELDAWFTLHGIDARAASERLNLKIQEALAKTRHPYSDARQLPAWKRGDYSGLKTIDEVRLGHGARKPGDNQPAGQGDEVAETSVKESTL